MLIIDESDIWAEQDQLDVVAFSLQSAVTSYSENDELKNCSFSTDLNTLEPLSE